MTAISIAADCPSFEKWNAGAGERRPIITEEKSFGTAYRFHPIQIIRKAIMTRKIVAASMFVAFIAMSTSGLMIFFVERPSFTIQMHPVHKLFGLVMVAAALAHIWLNRSALAGYLKARRAALTAGALAAALILLYGIALNNPVPQDLAENLDALAGQAEARHGE